MAEHRYWMSWKANFWVMLWCFLMWRTNLERNIYGVDINEESVEIARLWLTPKKGRKLFAQ